MQQQPVVGRRLGMNRRQVIMFSGAALAAEGLAQAQQVTNNSAAARNAVATTKALLKLSSVKQSYKIPKKDTKVTKYVGKCSAALALSIDQQQAASSIFQNALITRQQITGQM